MRDSYIIKFLIRDQNGLTIEKRMFFTFKNAGKEEKRRQIIEEKLKDDYGQKFISLEKMLILNETEEEICRLFFEALTNKVDA